MTTQERKYALKKTIETLTKRPDAYFILKDNSTVIWTSNRIEETFLDFPWLYKELLKQGFADREGIIRYALVDEETLLSFPSLYAKNGLIATRDDKNQWDVKKLNRDHDFYHRDKTIPDGYVRFQIPCGIDDLVFKNNPTINSYNSKSEMLAFIENFHR
jgi:hypothetical protein